MNQRKRWPDHFNKKLILNKKTRRTIHLNKRRQTLFSGKCIVAANKSSDLPGVSGIREGNEQHFDSESGVPVNITCDSVNPCCISQPYHGSKEYPYVFFNLSIKLFYHKAQTIKLGFNKARMNLDPKHDRTNVRLFI